MTESEALAIEEHIADLALAVQFTIQGWGETKRKISQCAIAIPLDAPAPANPIKCSEPMLDANMDAPMASHVASRPPKK